MAERNAHIEHLEGSLAEVVAAQRDAEVIEDEVFGLRKKLAECEAANEALRHEISTAVSIVESAAQMKGASG